MKPGVGALEGIVLLSAVAMRIASPSTADLSYLLIAGYAMFGRDRAIRALGLSWLFTMLNPGVAPDAPMASLDRYVVLAAAALSVSLRSKPGAHSGSCSVTRTTLLVGGFILIHSLLVSPLADVSILKAGSWLVTLVTLLAAWRGLSTHRREALVRELFGGLLLVMLASIPLTALPVGYLVNGTGFQGILSHPQTFGLVMAIVGASAAGRLMASGKPSWRMILVFGMSAALVVLSEARTAGVAMSVGVLLTVVVSPMLRRRSARQIFPGLFSRRLFGVISVAMVGFLLFSVPLMNRLEAYFVKGAERTDLVGAYNDSRGMLIQRSWDNIVASPVTGIGFGIASDYLDIVVERNSFGLPTSAPTEKGVLPIAVIEEIGIPGFILFLLWVTAIVVRSARNGSVEAMAVALTILLTNFGEATLFSAGGMGLLMLILISWSATGGRPPKAVGVRNA